MPTGEPTANDAPFVSLSVGNDGATTGDKLYLNPTLDILLTGAVTSAEYNCSAVFTLIDGASVSSELATVLVVAPAIDQKMNYMIWSNTLAQRHSYSFKLSCFDIFSVVHIDTNGVPVNGAFSVNPMLGGVEINSWYSLQSTGWFDEDLPLTYRFFYESTTANGATVVNVIKSKSEVANSSTYFPAGGNEQNNNTIVVGVTVYDALNAWVNMGRNVQVLPLPAQTASETNTMITGKLTESLNGGNSDDISRTLAVASSVLNKVDCSGLANGYCSGLHRAECSVVENTCGVCWAGYSLGVVGPHNSECADPAASTTAFERVSPASYHAPRPFCDASTSCENPFQQCNVSASECQFVVASCPMNCYSDMNWGSCVHTDAATGGAYGGWCFVGDVNCVSECVCTDGYSGDDCGISAADMAVLQETRSLLLSGLSSVSIDASGSDASSFVDNLATITQNPQELSASGVTQALDITNQFVSNAAGMTATSAVASLGGITSTLNSAITAGKKNGASSFANSKDLLVSFAGVLLESGGTETVANVIRDNFRVASFDARNMADADSSSMSMSMPTTALETLSAVVPPSVSMNSAPGNQMRVVVASTAAREYDSVVANSGINSTTGQLATNPLIVQLMVPADVDGATLPSEIVFTLQHVQTQPLGRIEDGLDLPVFNTSCALNVTSSAWYTCPNDAVVEHICDGTMYGVLTTQCPAATVASACVLTGADGLLDSTGCEVIAATVHNTTCRCQIPSSGPGGRRLSGSSGEMEIAAMSVNTFEGMVATFAVADEFASLDAFANVLMVISMFAVVWIGGFGAIALLSWRDANKATFDKVKGAEAILEKRKIADRTEPDQVKQYVLNYIDTVFPPVFMTAGVGSDAAGNRPRTSFWKRMWVEIRTHHRYITLFSSQATNERKSRYLLLFQLLSTQTMLMFMLALCYDLQGPADDGTCSLPANDNEESCLARKSMFDTSVSYCSWVPTLSSTGAVTGNQCVYADPEFDVMMLVISALVVALFTAIFDIPLEFLMSFLFAPTADDVKVREDKNTLVKKVGRRMSNVATSVTKRVRRASAMLVGGAAQREVKVGEMTRYIPQSTQEAHNYAAQSMSLIQPVLKSNNMKRQRSRTLCYEKAAMTSSRNITDSVDEANSKLATKPPVASYKALCQDIMLQRQLLKPSEVRAFDTQWSIILDEEDSFNNYDLDRVAHLDDNTPSNQLKDVMTTVERCILDEIKNTRSIAVETNKGLQYATDSHIGLDILHCFILDLLGRDTPAAKIFGAKSHEDFSHTYIVTKRFKLMVTFVLVVMNLFFVYFSLLRSYERGLSFQRAYVVACVVQFFIEIFVFQTIETICTNFLVPNLIADQVNEIAYSIKTSLDTMFSQKETDVIGSRVSRYHVLDVTQYLYVSTLVAAANPTLLESSIVAAYHTHLPGELAKKWQKYNAHWGTSYYFDSLVEYRHTATSNTPWTVFKFALFNTFFGAALRWGSVPMETQKTIIHLVQPLILAGVTVAAVVVYTNPALAYSCLTILIVLFGYWVYSKCFAKNTSSVGVDKNQHQLAEVMPVDEEASDDEFVVLDMESDSDSGSECSDGQEKASLSSLMVSDLGDADADADAYLISSDESSVSDNHSDGDISSVSSKNRYL